MNIAHNMDCMEAMRQMLDKCFDLAVCDPPYGINRFKSGETSRLRKYGSLDSVNNLRPTKEWFLELERVSKNQIVFGYNHLLRMVNWPLHRSIERKNVLIIHSSERADRITTDVSTPPKSP